MTALSSLAFNLAFFLWTALALILFLPVLLMPYAATYWFGRQWVRVSLWFLKHLVGLDHRVVGLEHVRRGPAHAASAAPAVPAAPIAPLHPQQLARQLRR